MWICAFDQPAKTSFHQNTHCPPPSTTFNASSTIFSSEDCQAKVSQIGSTYLSSLLAHPAHCTPTPRTAWSPPSPPSSSFSSLPNFPLPQKASCLDGSGLQRASVAGPASEWKGEPAGSEPSEEPPRPSSTPPCRPASASPSPFLSWRQRRSSTHLSPLQSRFSRGKAKKGKTKSFFQDVFNFTGRQMDVQGRNIKERSTIYTKLEGVRRGC